MVALLLTLLTAANPPIDVKYIGTAGWEIRSGPTTIVIDPNYSRLASAKDDEVVQPDAAAIDTYAPASAAMVIVSHSHWDHAMDAPAVARRSGAVVLGSDSTRNYAKAYGVDDKQIVPIRGGEDYQFDGFSVRVIRSLHSALYKKHWLDPAIIPSGVKVPMKAGDFHDGGAFIYLVRISGRNLLFVNTANFIESDLVNVKADVAFIAPGLRSEIYDYTCRLMHAIGSPKLVFPTHFDDYQITYDAANAEYAKTVEDMKGFVGEMKACAPATTVKIPRELETFRLP